MSERVDAKLDELMRAFADTCWERGLTMQGAADLPVTPEAQALRDYVLRGSADTRRLDWLEANACDLVQEIDFVPDGRIILMQVEYDEPKRPLREAIDAALATEADNG